MREINPKDITLFKRSFTLATIIMLVALFFNFILKWIIPTLVLSIIIFLILKYITKLNI
ncbi:hypothetical protein EV215_0753 [Hypnocyclicus thermotrophus]|uniref:Uncharacterized protein n=1 Tax=Hypnocyclicus thermotrophus TaxID=1627895 RepID=A0AA46DZ07_9FUSO|nr:hypothetical protein [Hypnocyclicus thermotrophus]TDT71380.1 hypothetical protein EV215_0753 [Hypnocyclicus thermotrophus]